MVEALIGLIIGGILVWLLLRGSDSKADNQSILLIQKQLGKVADTLDRKLGESNESIRTQIGESHKLVRDFTHQVTKLHEANKQSSEVLKKFENTLLHPKQRGILGEFILESLLNKVLSPEQFKMQHKFENGDTVDAVIYLGGKNDRTILPIDSKFPTENYIRLVEEPGKTAERNRLEKAFVQDIKDRIVETSKYIRPKEKTRNFAFMFIPSEAIFYDLLSNSVGSVQASSLNLIEFAWKKKVTVVSPTVFMAHLQTVSLGLRALEIEGTTKEIIVRVDELARHLGNYEQFLGKVGNSLSTTVNHYNKAHKELGKVDKDVLRITGKKVGIEPISIERPTRNDIDD